MSVTGDTLDENSASGYAFGVADERARTAPYVAALEKVAEAARVVCMAAIPSHVDEAHDMSTIRGTAARELVDALAALGAAGEKGEPDPAARLRAAMLECADGLEGDIPPGRKEAVLMRLRSEATQGGKGEGEEAGRSVRVEGK